MVSVGPVVSGKGNGVVIPCFLQSEQSPKSDLARFLFQHVQLIGQSHMVSKFYSSALVSTLDLCRNSCVSGGKNFIQEVSVVPILNDGIWDYSNLLSPLFDKDSMEVGDSPLDIIPLAAEIREEGKFDQLVTCEDASSFVTPVKGWEGDQLLLKGIEDRDEDCISDWVIGKIEEFGPFLGMSFEVLEEETMNLFRLIEKNCRGMNGTGGSRSVESKRLKSELRKLECGINYGRKGMRLIEGCRKGKGLTNS